MIIELGPQVKAWGIYPGGQSGNPGSKFYDNMVDGWVDGKMSELLFLQSSGETNPRLIGATALRGKQ
jgi:penicillin amidase